MTDDNKAPIRRFLEEVFKQGHSATIDELVAPDYIDHSAPGHRLRTK